MYPGGVWRRGWLAHLSRLGWIDRLQGSRGWCVMVCERMGRSVVRLCRRSLRCRTCRDGMSEKWMLNEHEQWDEVLWSIQINWRPDHGRTHLNGTNLTPPGFLGCTKSVQNTAESEEFLTKHHHFFPAWLLLLHYQILIQRCVHDPHDLPSMSIM